MTTFTFENLWKNHPVIADNGKACVGGGFDNSDTISNQCAINVSVAFEKCGVDIAKWDIQGCSLAKKEDSHKNHKIRAEEFANVLRKKSFKGVGSLQKITPENFDLALTGKTGIILFKDYWRREYEGVKETFTNRSGDHIDLWDGSKITTPMSWARIHLRIGDFGLHSLTDRWSDYEDSKEIWFWRVA